MQRKNPDTDTMGASVMPPQTLRAENGPPNHTHAQGWMDELDGMRVVIMDESCDSNSDGDDGGDCWTVLMMAAGRALRNSDCSASCPKSSIVSSNVPAFIDTMVTRTFERVCGFKVPLTHACMGLVAPDIKATTR